MLLRRSEERGYADHGWLKSKHSFSFAGYYDPRFMGFKDLRVINEDRILPESGFGTHPHRNMEIITYLVEGELTHEDTLGTQAKILPGEIQVMSAGNGIQHSEYNHHKDKTIHLLQIWLLPEAMGGSPYYEQADYTPKLKLNKWLKLVSGKDSDGLVKIRQEANLSVLKQNEAGALEIEQNKGKAYWLQVIKGELAHTDSQNIVLKAGDALAWEADEEDFRHWTSTQACELLLFEMNS